MGIAENLVGTWKLVAWYNQTENGQKLYPLGEDASGYISYTNDGFVFVQMMAANREDYQVNDPFGGTEREDSAAIKSQITYSGTFSVRDDHVFHHVTHASCPNWIGSEQARHFEFTPQGLRLSAAGAVFQGKEVTAYVDWVRAKP